MNTNELPENHTQKLLSYLQFNSYFSERYKLFYVSTPKVACTTLKWWFSELEGCTEELKNINDYSDGESEVHDNFHQIAPYVTGLDPDSIISILQSDAYFKFCVVRNPFTRIFSAWQSKILLQDPLLLVQYSNFDFYNLPIDNAKDVAIAFEKFLEYLIKNKELEGHDKHWTSQEVLLRPDLINYSSIYKIENIDDLNESLYAITSKKIIDNPKNVSLIPYSSLFITDRSSELIQELFAHDFELFGYDKSPPSGDHKITDGQIDLAIKAIKVIRGRHQRLARSSLEVANLETKLNERNLEVKSLESSLNEINLEVKSLESSLNEINLEVEFLTKKLQSILVSNSWLLTNPFRLTKKFLILFRQKLFSGLRKNKHDFKYVNEVQLRSRIDAEVKAIGNSGLFDHAYYLKNYSDNLPDLENPIKHYCEHGWRKGFNPSVDFDTIGYLNVYSDIKTADINPFWHYVTAGILEGRQPKQEPKKINDSFFWSKEVFHRIKSFLKLCFTLSRALPAAISFYRGSFWLTLIRAIRITSREGLEGVFRRVEFLTGTVINRKLPKSKFLYEVPEVRSSEFFPKVSVIVPNFNHAKYLRRRLDSIYSQTYQNFEVILLDDCSTDESLEILREYADLYSDNTITCFNEVNSGGVFHQWKKGLALCKGELVWIAESDDDCKENFLDELVRFFSNPGVMLAFARTEFIKNNKDVVFTQEQYLMDLFQDIWLSPFVKSANELVRIGWMAKNIVPNVSAALFRKPSELKLLDDEKWLNLTLCGDWVFYLHIIRGGLVGYSPATTNFYRQHIQSTSLKTQKKDQYYIEHEYVGKQLMHLYSLDSEDLLFQQRILFKHWTDNHVDFDKKDFLELYSIDRIQASSIICNRKPNIAIAIYALSTGGGEIFPINLANELWRRGYAVSIVNFQGVPDEPEIKRMVLPSIPIINLSKMEFIRSLLMDMNFHIVHSHHAFVDINIATFNDIKNCKHVVTMHGMYEIISPERFDLILPTLINKIDGFVYTTEKNLSPFSLEFRQKKRLYRINNALPLSRSEPVLRSALNISTDDFVLCLASRAIPEKGWEEAIASVNWAITKSSRKIHLILVGDGPEYDRLKSKKSNEFIHFQGFQSNVSDYFKASDIGILPSRFKGESSPLVLIECLLSGRPFLASNIGEIPNMLKSEQGMAGLIFNLEEWKVPIDVVGQHILELANNPSIYNNLLSNVSSAAKKFDFGEVVDKYELVYGDCLKSEF